MATSKKEKPQARRAAKKKKTVRKKRPVRKKAPRRAPAKAAKKKAPRRQPAKAAKAAATVDKLPAREIVRRPKPEKPKFLTSRSKNVQEKGFATMMSNWIEFAKVPLTYLTEEQLKMLYDAELVGRKRWNIVNRLHSAYNTKRIKRERDDLRKRCGLD